MRQRPYTCASFAFMFDEVYEFGVGETITQRYRLVIANGGWDAGQVEAGAGGMVGSEKMDEVLGSLVMRLCVASVP